MRGVVYYGNLAKAQLVLGCVQAAVQGVARDASRGHAASRAVLDRHLAELEEIEADLVQIINAERQGSDYPPLESDEPDSGRDVHEV